MVNGYQICVSRIFRRFTALHVSKFNAQDPPKGVLSFDCASFRIKHALQFFNNPMTCFALKITVPLPRK